MQAGLAPALACFPRIPCCLLPRDSEPCWSFVSLLPPQGDVRFAEVMGLMGAKVEWAPYSITITGEKKG